MRFQIVIMLALVGVSGCTAEKSLAPPESGLAEYAGKELRTADGELRTRLSRDVQALTGEAAAEVVPGKAFEPWMVTKFDHGRAEWLFLEIYPAYERPDGSAVRCQLFDSSWQRVKKQVVTTGVRLHQHDVAIQYSESLQQPLMVVKVHNLFLRFDYPHSPENESPVPTDLMTQYFAFNRGQFVLVRFEDSRQTMIPHNCAWETPDVGGPIRKQTAEQWIDRLGSSSVADQLETLVWLTGSHLSSGETRKWNHSQESVADARLWESVRRAPETRRALMQLKVSPDPWVAEYAKAALYPASDDGW